MKCSVITEAEVASSFTILPRCTLVHILKQSRSNAVVNQSRAVCACEESFCRRKTLNGFGEVRAVNVGDEPKRHGALAVMLQRLVGHDATMSEPPIPILMTMRIGLPGWWPFQAPHAPARKSPASYRARREPRAGPVSSTTPDKSEPSVSGRGGLTVLLPSRISASHGPTRAAATRTSTSPVAGITTSSKTTGPPKLWIRAAS